MIRDGSVASKSSPEAVITRVWRLISRDPELLSIEIAGKAASNLQNDRAVSLNPVEMRRKARPCFNGIGAGYSHCSDFHDVALVGIIGD
jgi:hypothetical protein